MNIDIERLKVDREYWDSVAPEWAKYYCTDANQFYALRTGLVCCIPRHQAPEAEWLDGLPPVGCECEMRHPGSGGWVKVEEVIAYYETEWAGSGSAVLLRCRALFSEHQDSIAPVNIDHELEFRPTPAPEQRQRDELEKYVYQKVNMAPMSMSAVDAAAEFYAERYNLEPKE